MKKVLALVMALCMIVALCACGNTAAPAATQAPAAEATTVAEAPAATEAPEVEMPTYEFKFSVAQGATDPTCTYAQMMIDEIAEKTDGHVKIELHPAGELGSINEVNELIASGAYMLNYTGSDAFSAVCPELVAMNCQYMTSDAEQVYKVMDSDWFKGQVDQLASQGNIRLLTLNWFTGYRHFATKFPVNTLADLAGKNMRVADSVAAIAFAKALGMSPVVTNKNEVYTGMSNGMLDAFENPLNGILSGSYYEVADYVILTKHAVANGGICMSEEIFQSMPVEYQNAFLEAAYNAGVAYKEYSLSSEADARAALEEKGMTFIELTAENFDEIKGAAATMYQDPALGVSVELYDQIQNIIK